MSDLLAEPAPLTPVFLLVGQSNMLGTTCLEEQASDPGRNTADKHVEFAWSNVHALNTEYPPRLYGNSNNEFRTLHAQQGEGADRTFWGPEFAFARAMHVAGWRRLTLIKVSRGGGGNTYWSRRAFCEAPAQGHMWGHLLDVLRGCLDALVEQRVRFRVCGLLYLQGESNSDAEAAAAGPRLNAFIDDLHAWLEARSAGASDGMHAVIGEIAASQSDPRRAKTARQHFALATHRDDASFVGTRDLALKSDGIHFGKDAKLEIGRRFARAYLLARDRL